MEALVSKAYPQLFIEILPKIGYPSIKSAVGAEQLTQFSILEILQDSCPSPWYLAPHEGQPRTAPSIELRQDQHTGRGVLSRSLSVSAITGLTASGNGLFCAITGGAIATGEMFGRDFGRLLGLLK